MEQKEIACFPAFDQQDYNNNFNSIQNIILNHLANFDDKIQ